MIIHYHGTPLTPRDELLKMAGKNFCVPFSDARDGDWCLANAQSVMWDNGRFNAYTQDKIVDDAKLYAWLEPRLGHPHWAVIPDEIDGTVEQQRALVAQWPFSKRLGAPVWHMALSIDYLKELADNCLDPQRPARLAAKWMEAK